MKNKTSLIVAVCLASSFASIARADIYPDATGELFTAAAQQLDITSVVVTNDSANLHFTINLLGNPQSTNWGGYAIALVTGSGGATNGTGTTNLISLTEGINYWVNCLGWGSPQLWQYNTNTLTWTNIGGATFANSSNSVSLVVPYASIGLTNGASFQFDAYTFNGTTGGAVDDLANLSEASTYWNVPYTNSLVDIYPNPAPSIVYWDNTNDLFAIANSPQLDISSVTVAGINSSNLSFTIALVGDPNNPSSGNYAIALATGPGGDTNGNGSGSAIALTQGINYWVKCLGWGSPQLWQFNSNTLAWSNIGGATYIRNSNSLTLTVPYQSVGLTPGARFQFDAYTFSGTGGAVDDLANPAQTINWWNVGYTNSMEKTYPLSIYNDATGDVFTGGSSPGPQFDISQVAVWNDSTNLSFIINLQAAPISPTDWGSYAVALATEPGGDTNGNGSGAAISLTEGMNYWVKCLGSGSPELWQFNASTLTWSNIGGATYLRSGKSLTLTVPITSVGLTPGQQVQFDAYTFNGTGGALDDLANPVQSVNWWNVGYTNNILEQYTLTGGSITPPSPVIVLSQAGTQLNLAASTVTGVSYVLQTTASLNPTSWSPVSTNSGTGGLITNTVTINPAATPAYYRYLVR